MALNIQTFKTRALTALLFVLVMLAGLFINEWTFAALFLTIMSGCFYEFLKISRLAWPGHTLRQAALGIVYIAMPMLMMIDLGINYVKDSGEPSSEVIFYSPLFPCAILFSIWINDTMAYMVGSFIGKTPFSKISPKKTWEGTLGGALLCVVAIALLGYYISAAQKIAWQHWLSIAAICAIFGTAGDLLESKIKRMAGIKDSGSFMPGHGGFLDRFDSLLVATPFVWLYVKLILQPIN